MTPVFMDGIWPDAWPQITDTPPTGTMGAFSQAQGEIPRILLARHPVSTTATIVQSQAAAGLG